VKPIISATPSDKTAKARNKYPIIVLMPTVPDKLEITAK
jgi:hypothetical protein